MTAFILISETEFEVLKNRILSLEQIVNHKTDTKLLSTKEASKFLKMSEVGIRKARKQGRLKANAKNSKEYQYEEQELLKFKNKNGINSPTSRPS